MNRGQNGIEYIDRRYPLTVGLLPRQFLSGSRRSVHQRSGKDSFLVVRLIGKQDGILGGLPVDHVLAPRVTPLNLVPVIRLCSVLEPSVVSSSGRVVGGSTRIIHPVADRQQVESGSVG